MTAVATIPLTQEQFQEAMMAKMRGLMGELMPPSQLEEIMKRAVEDAFFKPVTKKSDKSWGNDTYIAPPWCQEFLAAELKTEMKKQIEVWIASNQEMLVSHVKIALASGVTGCVTSYFENAFQFGISRLASDVRDAFSKLPKY